MVVHQYLLIHQEIIPPVRMYPALLVQHLVSHLPKECPNHVVGIAQMRAHHAHPHVAVNVRAVTTVVVHLVVLVHVVVNARLTV